MSEPNEPTSMLHPPGRPPDVNRLSAYAVDRADGTADPDRHVDDCAECAAVLTALDATRAQLGRAVGPMPTRVSQRLHGALAAEQHLTDDASGAVAGRHRAPQPDELAAARRLRRLRVVGSLAASLLVLGGGGYLVVDGVGGGSDSASESVAGGFSGEDSGADSDGAGGGTLGAESEPLPTYDRASLEAAVDELLAAAGTDDNGAPAPQRPVPEAAASVDEDCLASLPVATGAAISITRALYDGRPAIIVLFAETAGRVQVTVLSDCGTGPPMVLDQFDTER